MLMADEKSNLILERSVYKTEEQRQLGSYCLITELEDIHNLDGVLKVWDVPDDTVEFRYLVLDSLSSAQDLIFANIYNDPVLSACNYGFNKPDDTWTVVYCVTPYGQCLKAFRILTEYNPYTSVLVNNKLRPGELSTSSAASWKYHIGYEAFKDIGGNFTKKDNGEYKNLAINSDYYDDKSVDDRYKTVVEE
jgi:hypothetical protein